MGRAQLGRERRERRGKPSSLGPEDMQVQINAEDQRSRASSCQATAGRSGCLRPWEGPEA